MRLTLSRGVSLAVLASAKTEADHHEDLGCSILGPPSRPVRKAHAWLKKQVQRLGPAAVTEQAAELVKAMEASSAYDALCDGKKRRFGRRVLRQDVIFPKAEKFKPTVLHLRRDELGLDVPMRADEWPIVNEFFAGPRLIELIIAITVFEGLALTAYHRLTSKGVAPKEFAANLLSGLCLMLALRNALLGQSPGVTALFLSASGLIHANDLWRRWKS